MRPLKFKSVENKTEFLKESDSGSLLPRDDDSSLTSTTENMPSTTDTAQTTGEQLQELTKSLSSANNESSADIKESKLEESWSTRLRPRQ